MRALLLLALAAAAGSPPAANQRPNVLLISVDTLRADHCAFEPGARPTTPFLARLARRGTLFRHAYSTSSWTPPAMASLFTSLPPHAHGVVRGTIRNHRLVEQDELAAEFVTLAEHFRQHGYRTAGVTTNIHLSRATGFAQGFEQWAALWWAPAERTTARALELARAQRDERPLFLWVHYLDPHDPYRAREPWASRWAGGAPLAPLAGRPLTELRGRVSLRRDPSERRALVALYDSEIRAVDAAIERLVGGLRARRGWVIVFTADHGESLLERGLMGHGNGLYEQEIRIPLLVVPPAAPAQARVDRPVSLLDVFPTLLELAGLPVPAGIAGRSLRPLLEGRPAAPRPLVCELSRPGIAQHAVIGEGVKLYVGERPARFVRLFDLRHDPLETNSVLAQQPQAAAALRAVYARWLRHWPPHRARRVPGPADERQIERLRSLGYVD